MRQISAFPQLLNESWETCLSRLFYMYVHIVSDSDGVSTLLTSVQTGADVGAGAGPGGAAHFISTHPGAQEAAGGQQPPVGPPPGPEEQTEPDKESEPAAQLEQEAGPQRLIYTLSVVFTLLSSGLPLLLMEEMKHFHRKRKVGKPIILRKLDIYHLKAMYPGNMIMKSKVLKCA